MKIEAYEKNCSGDFVVEDGSCMLCCLPEMEAPELIESDDYSCYFKKQPETKEEIGKAIEAINVSCCNGVIYTGNDKKVIRQILGNQHEWLDTVPSATMVDIWTARLKRIFKFGKI